MKLRIVIFLILFLVPLNVFGKAEMEANDFYSEAFQWKIWEIVAWVCAALVFITAKKLWESFGENASASIRIKRMPLWKNMSAGIGRKFIFKGEYHYLEDVDMQNVLIVKAGKKKGERLEWTMPCAEFLRLKEVYRIVEPLHHREINGKSD